MGRRRACLALCIIIEIMYQKVFRILEQTLSSCTLRASLEHYVQWYGAFVATPILSNALWNLIEALLPTRNLNLTVGDHACPRLLDKGIGPDRFHQIVLQNNGFAVPDKHQKSLEGFGL